jgi:hypothetical protein
LLADSFPWDRDKNLTEPSEYLAFWGRQQLEIDVVLCQSALLTKQLAAENLKKSELEQALEQVQNTVVDFQLQIEQSRRTRDGLLAQQQLFEQPKAQRVVRVVPDLGEQLGTKSENDPHRDQSPYHDRGDDVEGDTRGGDRRSVHRQVRLVKRERGDVGEGTHDVKEEDAGHNEDNVHRSPGRR